MIDSVVNALAQAHSLSSCRMSSNIRNCTILSSVCERRFCRDAVVALQTPHLKRRVLNNMLLNVFYYQMSQLISSQNLTYYNFLLTHLECESKTNGKDSRSLDF